MRTIRRVLAIVAAIVAILAMAAPATAANPVYRTYRADGFTSTGILHGRGFYQGPVNVPGQVMDIHACDLYADGMRTVVWVYNDSRSYKVQDANGANNSCGIMYDVPHLIVGTIRVCRQNGSGGTPINCGYAWFDYSWAWEA